MNTLLVVMLLISGALSFALLLAALIGFQDKRLPSSSDPLVVRLFEESTPGVLLSVVRGVVSNWRARPALRRVFYWGLGSLSVFVMICVLLSLRRI